jgi:hypothetical protein
MSDKATMLRETDEALADLRAMFDWLTEEQVRRVWLGVSGVRDSVTHVRQHPVQNRDSHSPSTDSLGTWLLLGTEISEPAGRRKESGRDGN